MPNGGILGTSTVDAWFKGREAECIKEEEAPASQTLLGLNRTDLENTTYEVMKRPWSEEEDERLVTLVEEEKMSWNDISRLMHDRTYKMCYSRYKRIKLNAKNSWTQKEDQQLRDLVQKYGKQWKHFAKYF
jgi:thymidylate synthase